MNAISYACAFRTARRLLGLMGMACLLALFAACAQKPGKTVPESPDVKKLAYGASMTVPASWRLAETSEPAATPKETLDNRRRGGESVLLLRATKGGPASSASTQPQPGSLIAVVLVNQDRGFLLREFAEKLKPHEFEAMARDVLAEEKAAAKKNKNQKFQINALQIERQNLGGNLTIFQRLLVVGPGGKAIRELRWDVYLPNGAGLAITAGFDPEIPETEEEIVSIVNSLRTN